MKKRSLILALLACSFVLAGCAVSGVAPETAKMPASSVQAKVNRGALPVVPQLPQSDEVLQSTDMQAKKVALSEKFAQSDQMMMTVEEANREEAVLKSEIEQAYAAFDTNLPVVSTKRADLKPYVGRWQLKPSGARAKMQKLGSYFGMSEGCELVLEDESAGVGYKASGNSACPTSLFMLESWVAFDNRLVLRDHMGDEIVQLTSRGEGLWVGVGKDGNMLVLNKS